MSTGELIAEIAAVIDRFLVMPSRAAVLTTALFALHTWNFEAAHATPFLIIESPVKRSGKTRFEELIEHFVRRPWRITSASEAALFRKIERECPTLLLDEVDAIFGRSVEATEGIRQILNSGNRPGASVTRTVGDSHEVADFAVYSPRVLAGINCRRWPDTVTDRGIVITLRRKTPDEKVERLRVRKLQAETEELRAKLARWGQEHTERLVEGEPELPAALDDRAADAWEPLLAIAELADSETANGWAKRARKAAVLLSAGRDAEDDADHGVVALTAIRTIIGNKTAIHTTTIVEKLNADEELPFRDYRKGAGLTGRGLSKLLRPFGISPHPVQIDGKQARGYHRDQFADAWGRYCPTETGAKPENAPGGDANVSMRQLSNNHRGFAVDGSHSETAPGNPIRQPQTAREHCEVDALTDVGAQLGPEPQTDACAGSHSGVITLADLTDAELLEAFPDAEIKSDGGKPAAPCNCGKRARQWRLRGPALEATYRYLSNDDYVNAVHRGCDVIPKGPKSGWTYETTPLDLGHPWQCALCHPPADGLNIEIQEARPGDALTPSATNPISGRLTWRPGYRWRRDGQPDGEPLPPIVEKSGAWSYELAQEPRVNRAYVDPDEPPIIDRYAERSEKRAEIEANAQAWQRLTHMAAGQR